MIKKLLLIALFFLSACETPQQEPLSSGYENIKVKEVVDGDTIRLSDGKLVRYIGIDTPEMRLRRGNDYKLDPQPFAREAKQLNEESIGNKSVRLEFDAQIRDQYNRLLAYVFVDGAMINERLLQDGLASLYSMPPNLKYVDRFVAAQNQARQDKRGMWGAYETVSSDDAAGYINQIRTVRGKVLDSNQSEKALYLNFGRDYKTDFTVVIFSSSLDKFLDKKINPLTYYTGKTVEVTGKIRQYNGPEIIVNIPEEIRVAGDR